MKKILLLLAFLSFIKVNAQNYTISGFIVDKLSAEPIINATVVDVISNKGTYSNNQGFFSLTLPKGKVEILISSIGFNKITDEINLTSNINKQYELVINEIDAVEITGNSGQITQNQTGFIELSLKDIKLLPIAGFQTDVIKSLQIMPGVSSGVEGVSAMIVRGGGFSQNLVLIDGTPLYHYTHLEGLVSSISTEAVNKIKLYKSGFPAKFGNKLSSVLDIRLKDGDLNNYHYSYNIGLITSGISFEGPIEKQKSSFILSARGFTLQPGVKIFPYTLRSSFFSGYGFYDIFLKVNRKFGNKNRIYGSFYLGKDKRKSSDLTLESENNSTWKNILGSFHWNKQWGGRTFSDFSIYSSTYSSETESLYYSSDDSNNNIVTEWAENKNSINDYGIKWDFNYLLNSKLKIDYGISYLHQIYQPSTLNSETILLFPDYTAVLHYANLANVYVSADYNILDKISLNASFRLNGLLTSSEIYLHPEPRATMSFNINNENSFKASYAVMYQNSHVLSTSGLGLSSNYYIPASNDLPAQKSIQYALGFYSGKQQNYTLSFEAFYKELSNLTELKELVLLSDISQTWEQKTETGGIGKTFGLELYFNKTFSSLNIGLSYTLSKSTRQFENINNGFEYLYDYDRTHDLAFFVNTKLGKKWSANATWYYMTGRPFTLGIYRGPSLHHLFGYTSYGGFLDMRAKNSVRMAAYHRLDINFERKVVKGKKRKSERIFNIGVYNVYNRPNPQYYYWESTYLHGGNTQGEAQSVELVSQSSFPLIPYISYSRSF